MGNRKSKLFKKLPKTISRDDLEFLGSGIQGEVYKLDQYLCIKLFKKNKYHLRELNNLKIGQGNPIFPKLYDWGDDYIIREFINGTPLSSYLDEGRSMTLDVYSKIIFVLEELSNLGFTRLDFRPPHLFFLPNGEVKLIDPANLMLQHRTYPEQLLRSLKDHGVKDLFLDFVRDKSPDIYCKWYK